MKASEIDDPLRQVIRHWRLTDLAEFAALRHGFLNTDGGFGITYPGDLDGYAREVEGISIPEGSVQVLGFWGRPEGYEFLVPESTYLRVLAKVLDKAGHSADAVRVRSLIESP